MWIWFFILDYIFTSVLIQFLLNVMYQFLSLFFPKLLSIPQYLFRVSVFALSEKFSLVEVALQIECAKLFVVKLNIIYIFKITSVQVVVADCCNQTTLSAT